MGDEFVVVVIVVVIFCAVQLGVNQIEQSHRVYPSRYTQNQINFSVFLRLKRVQKRADR